MRGVPVETVELFQCLISFANQVYNGQLTWGPMLAWGKVQDDELFQYRQENHAEAYWMPRRGGLTMRQYPWAEHAEHFWERTRRLLMTCNSWTADKGVAGIEPEFALKEVCATSTLQQNKILIQNTTGRPVPPAGFTPYLLDEDYLSSVNVTQISEQEDLPTTLDQYWDFTRDEPYTVWMQSQSEFLC